MLRAVIRPTLPGRALAPISAADLDRSRNGKLRIVMTFHHPFNAIACRRALIPINGHAHAA